MFCKICALLLYFILKATPQQSECFYKILLVGIYHIAGADLGFVKWGGPFQEGVK